MWFLKIFYVRDCGWNVLQKLRKGVDTPVLIFAAQDDNVVSIKLTQMIAQELRRQNSLDAFVTFEYGGHSVQHYHASKIYQTTLSFFQQFQKDTVTIIG